MKSTMKNRRFTFVTWLVSFALLVSMLSGVLASGPAKRETPQNQLPDDKLSSDLRERVRKGNGNERITVVVHPKASWSDEQDADVRSRGGRVKQQLDNLNMRVLELPAHAVEALAARDDVEYVSPDREIQSTGHLKMTTVGTNALTNPLAKGTLDGTGIGIAIFDSGIDSTHISFGTSRSSRIAKSVDFTGEGRTDDPYGHGTHVASTAASDGSISSLAYMGIASNSKLINVRVLNSEGRGTLSGLLSAVDWVMANRTTYNIKVVNMSLGMAAVDSYKNDPACKAVRRLVDAGIVVVVAAGNYG
jgi:serine protease AprX